MDDDLSKYRVHPISGLLVSCDGKYIVKYTTTKFGLDVGNNIK